MSVPTVLHRKQATRFIEKEILETELSLSLSPEQAMDLIVMLTTGLSHNGLDENVTLRIDYRKYFTPVGSTDDFVKFTDNSMRQVAAQIEYISAITTREDK
jgi:hypothetical protein